ncbi:MAG TPA: 16S rRNA (guanine(966)-N(2))-methyltransferase RsmD [Gemmatimonadales bacterium]|nr:16S rRNA (guanine(966)-N(2))-methyltransferase RsmD [Gemmatimonadales bacterium]
MRALPSFSSFPTFPILRIVAGQFGGRRLVMPNDTRVRPTADRVREAWMSILGSELAGARVLDLFAGSGALGLEALSRGAESVTFVEMNPPSLKALHENISALGAEGATTVHRGDAMRFAERLPPAAFDVVVADPPYTVDHASRLVALFRRTPFGRILSVEHSSTLELDGDTRRYGDTAITFCHAP